MPEAEPGGTTITRTLARLEAADPAAALAAQHALDWLLGGDAAGAEASLDALCRFGVQQFCWYELPFKWIVDPDARRETVLALARFFDLAGMPRDAEVCRAPETAAVLRAWDEGAAEGFRAFRRSMAASGVEPPDLPDLVWGTAMREEEFGAFWSVAMMLELAVDSQVLVPGAPGWRATQADLVRGHLDQPRDERFGESLRQAVLTERLSTWVDDDGRRAWSRARVQLLAPIANALLSPVEPPRRPAQSMGGLVWLLSTADRERGVSLTANGNLPRVVVEDAVTRFPSWGATIHPSRRVPREQDLPALVALHRFVRSAKLARRTGRRLELTALGRSALAEPQVLWSTVAAWLGTGATFDAAVRELLLAVLLHEPLVTPGRVIREAQVALTEMGWHTSGGGDPVPDAVLLEAVAQTEVLLIEFGVIRRPGSGPGSRPGARRWRLSDAGRRTALAALRTRALMARRL